VRWNGAHLWPGPRNAAAIGWLSDECALPDTSLRSYELTTVPRLQSCHNQLDLLPALSCSHGVRKAFCGGRFAWRYVAEGSLPVWIQSPIDGVTPPPRG
jgi:hypothetical protein